MPRIIKNCESCVSIIVYFGLFKDATSAAVVIQQAGMAKCFEVGLQDFKNNSKI
jgi:hypothetical protein